MGSFNKCFLMGNLTRDVELRDAGSTTVGQFGIAVNRKYKTRNGAQEEEVSFIDCDVWDKTAELMAERLSKGSPVFIEGRLKMDTWQDKTTGDNRSKLKVVVENFQFIGSRDKEEAPSF